MTRPAGKVFDALKERKWLLLFVVARRGGGLSPDFSISQGERVSFPVRAAYPFFCPNQKN